MSAERTVGPASSGRMRAGASVPPILVVDDDEDIRDAVAELLRSEGFCVATAANGRQALSHLRQSGAALVFLDLEMPELDGASLIEIVRADAALAKTPIVVVTASRGYSLPADIPVLRKPFGSDRLVELARAHARVPKGVNV